MYKQNKIKKQFFISAKKLKQKRMADRSAVKLPPLLAACLAVVDEIFCTCTSPSEIKNLEDAQSIWEKHAPKRWEEKMAYLTDTPQIEVFDNINKALHLWVILCVKTDYSVMERKITGIAELAEIISGIFKEKERNETEETTRIIPLLRSDLRVEVFLKDYEIKNRAPKEEVDTVFFAAFARSIEERLHDRMCDNCDHKKK